MRYLSTHRADGAELIANVLGRTPLSVRVKAARLRISLEHKAMTLCPFCGTYFVRDNNAGRHGMCIACWERRKAEAMEEQAAELRERKRYDAAKKAKRVQARK